MHGLTGWISTFSMTRYCGIDVYLPNFPAAINLGIAFIGPLLGTYTVIYSIYCHFSLQHLGRIFKVAACRTESFYSPPRAHVCTACSLSS
jgi:hypothetical protein